MFHASFFSVSFQDLNRNKYLCMNDFIKMSNNHNFKTCIEGKPRIHIFIIIIYSLNKYYMVLK